MIGVMPAITFRFGALDDVPAILEFWRWAAVDDPQRPSDTSEMVERLIERDAAALVLAVDDDGGLVGSVIAGWDGWRCHLYRVAVAPDRRREGIGAALVREAERRFRELGGTRADAMVLDANDVAHQGWRAWGYRPQDDCHRWVKPLTG